MSPVESQITLQRLLQYISESRDILSQTTSMREHFSSELEFLNRREKIWKEQRFRVGLLGITSSGKSTLVNALLQEKLLPEAVRPSSNSLVICQWGKLPEATVFFKDVSRKPETYKGLGVKGELARFADEATNPNNREGVEEISVKSPSFKLGQDVSLIDTPGLDAYGYDDHERLTLEVLLPTVDAVLFVTTCKANSDEKIKDYVCLASEHNKPVIVIQNMIDSIVEKFGPHGQILETKNQVAEKHLRRLQSVLKRAGVDAVSLSQVSARWALDGKLEQSGLNELVDIVRSRLNMLVPIAQQGRLKQLERWLDEVIEAEQIADNPIALRKRYEEELVTIHEEERRSGKRYEHLIHSWSEAKRVSNSEGRSFCVDVSALGKKDVTEAYEIKNKIEKWLRSSPTELGRLNKLLLAQVVDDCDTLNLRMEDVTFGTPKWNTPASLDFETTEKNDPKKVEQSGGWGWFKRKMDLFDSGWGFDEYERRWTEIKDLSAFQQIVTMAVKQELSQVEGFVTDAIKRSDDLKYQVLAELERKRLALHEKEKSIADVELRLSIANELRKIRLAIKPNDLPITDSTLPSGVKMNEDLYEIQVSPAALTITRLAKLISRQRFLQLRHDGLQSIRGSKPASTGRVVIVGFDQDSVCDFVNRFWFDKLEINSASMEPFQAVHARGEEFCHIAVAIFTGNANDPSEQVRQFMNFPTTLFLLVDIQQIGASESMLSRAAIPIDQEHCSTVLVMQTVKELQQSNTVAEGLMELRQLIKRRQFKPLDILVNDEDILFTEITRLLIMKGNRLRTVAYETEFLDSLPVRSRKMATSIIRAWEDLEVDSN